jgi:hypothetical protein
MATVNSIIGKINWSLSPDIAVAATEDAKQFLALQDEFKASITNNVFNAVLDSGARSFNGTNDINYAQYVNVWRAAAGYGPQIKTRSVVINAKDEDLDDESKGDITAAQFFAKQIKWSLNPNPVEQATEDAQEFLKLADAAKTYPNFNVSSIIAWVARRSSNDLPGLLSEYSVAWSKLVGDNENDYWTRVLGEKPTKTWYDGGIKAIGDIVIAGMNDPKSYQFDHFTVSVGKYKGTPAWKVDYYFRGKNAFGGLVLDNVYAYMLHGEVIGIERPKD